MGGQQGAHCSTQKVEDLDCSIWQSWSSFLPQGLFHKSDFSKFWLENYNFLPQSWSFLKFWNLTLLQLFFSNTIFVIKLQLCYQKCWNSRYCNFVLQKKSKFKFHKIITFVQHIVSFFPEKWWNSWGFPFFLNFLLLWLHDCFKQMTNDSGVSREQWENKQGAHCSTKKIEDLGWYLTGVANESARMGWCHHEEGILDSEEKSRQLSKKHTVCHTAPISYGVVVLHSVPLNFEDAVDI